MKQYKWAIAKSSAVSFSHSRSGIREELCPLRWSFCPLCRSVWSFYAGYQTMCPLSLVPSSSWCYAAYAHCVSLSWCRKWGKWFEKSSRVSKRYSWWVSKQVHFLPLVEVKRKQRWLVIWLLILLRYIMVVLTFLHKVVILCSFNIFFFYVLHMFCCSIVSVDEIFGQKGLHSES